MNRSLDSNTNLKSNILEITSQEEPQHFQDILSKINKIQAKSKKIESSIASSEKLVELINLIEKILEIIKNNFDYLNGDKKFRDDFNKSFSTIKSIFRLTSKLLNPAKIKQDTKKLDKDINNYIDSLKVFSSIFEKIMTETTKSQVNQEILSIRLGLECTLFNACVVVKELDKFPYLESKFLQIYQFYDQIDKNTEKISLFKSYCQTGKTTFFALFLLIKSLKDNNNCPFVLMTTQTPLNVDFHQMFFEKFISKYVTITGDTNTLKKIYNDYNRGQIGHNLTLGILTSYNFLPLIKELEASKVSIFNHTRFIIDDLHQITFHHSVIASEILNWNEKDTFKLDLNVVLLSSFFPPELTDLFKNIAKVTPLIEKPFFEVTDEPFNYEMTSRIDIKIQKVIKSVVYRMAIKQKQQQQQPESETQQKPDNKTKTKPENNTKTKDKSDTKPETKNDPKPKNKPDTKNDPKPKDKSDTKNDPKPKDKPDTKNDPKPKDKPDTRPENEKEKINITPKNKAKNKGGKANKQMADSSIKDGHILCFLPNTGICKAIKNALLFITKFEEGTDSQRKVCMLKKSIKQDEDIENFYQRLREEADNIKSKFKKECIFFYPITFSGIYEDNNNILAIKQFPEYLNDVHKLILGTNYLKSFKIDDVSVVIDSALEKELIFDPINGLTKYHEKPASEVDLSIRKGFLGSTMDGLYIQFQQKKTNPNPNSNANLNSNANPNQNDKSTKVLIRDITANYLSMKEINIDLEKLKNLPYKVKEENYKYTIDVLKRLGAIDDSLKITQFGHEMIKIVHDLDISYFYAAAIVKYSQSFSNELEKNYAYFISVYISLLIKMDKQFFGYEISTKASSLYDPNSDIVTFYNVFKSILLLPNSNQSSSFKHCCQKITKLQNNLQKIVDLKFPSKTVVDIIKEIHSFEKNQGGIYKIIDSFIKCLDDDWKNLHYLKFGIIRKIKTNKEPELVFFANDRLKSDENQAKGRVFVLNRPGEPFLSTPSHCYCFNIELRIENQTYQRFIGHLIHRAVESYPAITTFPLNHNNILNPWFNVLTDIYFNDTKKKEEEKIKFYAKQNNDKIYLSFKSILRDEKENKDNQFIDYKLTKFIDNEYIMFFNIAEIYQGIQTCIDIFPYVPRSILIYNSQFEVITEVKSVGANDYESVDATHFCGKRLTSFLIQLYQATINDLSKTNSEMRICCLFIEDSCKYNELDTENLYIIDKPTNAQSDLLSIVKNRANEMKNKDQNDDHEDLDEYGQFQFSPWFIHPSLFSIEDARNQIMNWFDKYCDFVKIKSVDNYKLRMKISQIQELQNYLFFKEDQVIKEMNLQYKAIPFPKYLKKKIPKEWQTDKKFNTVIVKSNEEAEKVSDFICKLKDKFKKHSKINPLFIKYDIDPSCCYNNDDCNDSDLSELPFTILLDENNFESMKICKKCILERLSVATQNFVTNGKLNQEGLKNICSKPDSITYLSTNEYKAGTVKYPQIPLGQYIYVLFNCNNKALSEMVSAHLKSVSKFTIRYKMRSHITFCPNHRDKFFKIKGNISDIKCDECDCVYCTKCMYMHPKNYTCITTSMGDIKVCPLCYSQTLKISGCSTVKCRCGTLFCYICRHLLQSQADAALHYNEQHKNTTNNNSTNNDNNNNNNNNTNSNSNNTNNDNTNSNNNNTSHKDDTNNDNDSDNENISSSIENTSSEVDSNFSDDNSPDNFENPSNNQYSSVDIVFYDDEVTTF